MACKQTSLLRTYNRKRQSRNILCFRFSSRKFHSSSSFSRRADAHASAAHPQTPRRRRHRPRLTHELVVVDCTATLLDPLIDAVLGAFGDDGVEEELDLRVLLRALDFTAEQILAMFFENNVYHVKGKDSELVLDLAGRLDADGYDRAVQIAELPDLVRGYEQIKLDNVARYRARLAELLPV